MFNVLKKQCIDECSMNVTCLTAASSPSVFKFSRPSFMASRIHLDDRAIQYKFKLPDTIPTPDESSEYHWRNAKGEEWNFTKRKGSTNRIGRHEDSDVNQQLLQKHGVKDTTTEDMVTVQDVAYLVRTYLERPANAFLSYVISSYRFVDDHFFMAENSDGDLGKWTVGEGFCKEYVLFFREQEGWWRMGLNYRLFYVANSRRIESLPLNERKKALVYLNWSFDRAEMSYQCWQLAASFIRYSRWFLTR